MIPLVHLQLMGHCDCSGGSNTRMHFMHVCTNTSMDVFTSTWKCLRCVLRRRREDASQATQSAGGGLNSEHTHRPREKSENCDMCDGHAQFTLNLFPVEFTTAAKPSVMRGSTKEIPKNSDDSKF